MPTSPENTKTSSEEYVFVRLNKDNLDDVVKLHTEVHSTPPSYAFQKKYDTAFAGVEYAGFIAYDKNQFPAAYYGVMPCFIQSGDKRILAAQSGDTMTHPGHRGKGLVVKLSHKTFELCRELGIHLLFGFPNQNFYPITIKHLGWKETEKLDRFEIKVGGMLQRIFRPSQKRREEMLSKIRIAKKGIKNSVISDGFSGILKDEAFLNYKAFSQTYVLKFSCGEIWIKLTDQLVIGDIDLTDNNREVFFRDIKALARKLGVNKISFQASPGCSMHDLFRSNYKPIPSFPVLFQDFGSGIPLEKIKFTFSDIDIF